MKDKNTILNEMMDNAAEIIEAKIDYILLVIQKINQRANMADIKAILEADVEKMRCARDIIVEYSGSWA